MREALVRKAAHLIYATIPQIMTATRATMAAPQTAAKTLTPPSALVLGRSGEFWDLWLIIALCIAAMAAVLVGLTTAASIISHKLEAERAAWELGQYKLTVDARVADARAKGIEAGETASNALVKAAEFQKEAELAKASAAAAALETERLRATLQWRTLSPDETNCLVASLPKSTVKKVHLAWVFGDPESFWFASQIAGAFKRAGWMITGQAIPVIDSISTGVSIPSEPSGSNDGLRTAFAACGIATGSYAIPQAGMTMGSSAAADEATLYVGIRPSAVTISLPGK